MSRECPGFPAPSMRILILNTLPWLQAPGIRCLANCPRSGIDVKPIAYRFHPCFCRSVEGDAQHERFKMLVALQIMIVLEVKTNFMYVPTFFLLRPSVRIRHTGQTAGTTLKNGRAYNNQQSDRQSKVSRQKCKINNQKTKVNIMVRGKRKLPATTNTLNVTIDR